MRHAFASANQKIQLGALVMNATKRISPQAIFALKESLSVIYWKKDELKDFLNLSIANNTIIATLNWEATKREVAKELVERMTAKYTAFEKDLLALILSVCDMTDFSHLDYWDLDGSKKKKAFESVKRLRELTVGYINRTKDEEEARKRKIQAEKKIQKNKSLSEELNILNEKFKRLAANKNVQQRGFELEKFLVELFLLYELDPRGSFKINGEQIDGAFTFDGSDYLLEAKWTKQVGRSDLASFCYKVESKLKSAVGLLITIDGLTPEAISPDFKSIIVMNGLDLVCVLEGRVSLTDLLYKKRRRATETGNIFVTYYEL